MDSAVASIPSTTVLFRRWNPSVHADRPDLAASVRNFRSRGIFFDVSIFTAPSSSPDSDGSKDVVFDEDQVIRAHKIVLASSSRVLEDILASTESEAHPVVFLRGARPEDVRSLVDFFYCGEVRVPKEDVDSFLTLAKDLQVNVEVGEEDHIDEDYDHGGVGGESGIASFGERSSMEDDGEGCLPKLSRNYVDGIKCLHPGDDQIDESGYGECDRH